MIAPAVQERAIVADDEQGPRTRARTPEVLTDPLRISCNANHMTSTAEAVLTLERQR
jgi:hypothetical protein